MAGPSIGASGLVTSWTGTANTALIGALDEHTISLSIDGGTADRTPFTSGGLSFARSGQTMRSWTGTINGRARLGGSPPSGYLGAVTFASGYALLVKSWEMTIETAAQDISAFGSTATLAGWKTFRPQYLKWGGSYSAMIDETTALVLPVAPNTAAAAATFKLGEASAVAQTLAGNILVSNLGVNIKVDELNMATFAFMGDDTLTAAGASNLFAAGAIGTPDWDTSGSDGVPDTTLTVQAASGRTYAGPAFWQSISMSITPDNFIDVAIQIQGAGALAIS